MQNSSQNKPSYFDPETFVNKVFEGLGIDPKNEQSNGELRDEIVIALGDRIMATVFNNFSQKEIKLFDSMLRDHEELDPIDVVMIIAPQIEGLKDALERNINSLYFELIRDADDIRALMLQKIPAKS